MPTKDVSIRASWLDRASRGIERTRNAMQRAARESARAWHTVIGPLSAVRSALISIQGALLTLGLVVALKATTSEALQTRAALSGLSSVAAAYNQNQEAVRESAETLVSDGLLSFREASLGLKNLLATGLSIDQATLLMKGLQEQAIFNRQAHFELGQAVVATTEGIRNENSVLSDATGTTRNLFKMYQDYAKELNKSVTTLSRAEKAQAAYRGFLEETNRSQGDLQKVMGEAEGQLLSFTAAWNLAKKAVGELFLPALTEVLKEIKPIIVKIKEWAEANAEVVGSKIAEYALLTWDALKKLAKAAKSLWDFAGRNRSFLLTIFSIGAMTLIIAKMIVLGKAILGVVAAVKGLTLAGAALAGGPITALVGVIAALPLAGAALHDFMRERNKKVRKANEELLNQFANAPRRFQSLPARMQSEEDVGVTEIDRAIAGLMQSSERLKAAISREDAAIKKTEALEAAFKTLGLTTETKLNPQLKAYDLLMKSGALNAAQMQQAQEKVLKTWETSGQPLGKLSEDLQSLVQSRQAAADAAAASALAAEQERGDLERNDAIVERFMETQAALADSSRQLASERMDLARLQTETERDEFERRKKLLELEKAERVAALKERLAELDQLRQVSAPLQQVIIDSQAAALSQMIKDTEAAYEELKKRIESEKLVQQVVLFFSGDTTRIRSESDLLTFSLGKLARALSDTSTAANALFTAAEAGASTAASGGGPLAIAATGTLALFGGLMAANAREQQRLEAAVNRLNAALERQADLENRLADLRGRTDAERIKAATDTLAAAKERVTQLQAAVDAFNAGPAGVREFGASFAELQADLAEAMAATTEAEIALIEAQRQHTQALRDERSALLATADLVARFSLSSVGEQLVALQSLSGRFQTAELDERRGFAQKIFSLQEQLAQEQLDAEIAAIEAATAAKVQAVRDSSQQELDALNRRFDMERDLLRSRLSGSFDLQNQALRLQFSQQFAGAGGNQVMQGILLRNFRQQADQLRLSQDAIVAGELAQLEERQRAAQLEIESRREARIAAIEAAKAERIEAFQAKMDEHLRNIAQMLDTSLRLNLGLNPPSVTDVNIPGGGTGGRQVVVIEDKSTVEVTIQLQVGEGGVVDGPSIVRMVESGQLDRPIGEAVARQKHKKGSLEKVGVRQ